MNTAIASPPATAPHTSVTNRTAPIRRFIGIVARTQSYRSIAYLLVGLPLSTVWFTAVVSGISIAGSMLAVALLGVPMLAGMWYVIRAFANVERATANALLDQDIPLASMRSSGRGNPWVRLRAMTRERDRWRELGYLLLRFPAAIATFTVAVTALTVPVVVAYAPIHVRYVDGSLGDWFWSSQLEDFASDSMWSWLLVPLGLTMLIVCFHLVAALATACGRWTAARLDADGAWRVGPTQTTPAAES
jgi:hypothetical protein